MSVAQAVLDDLVELLAATGPPRPVVLTGPAALTGPTESADVGTFPAVGLCVVALDRIGRSQRNGPLLDLSLVVDVITTGPAALAHTEQLLVALERTPWAVSARPAGVPASSPVTGLGFRVQFTFSVPVTPEGPEPVVVQHPPEAQIRVSSERSPAW